MFKRLQELLLIEADDEDIVGGALKILDPIKKGLKNAADRHKQAISKRKDAEREAESAQREAEKKASDAVKLEKNIAGKAEKEAEAAAKATSAEHKLKSAEAIVEIKNDIEVFVGDFFDRFPFHGGAGGAEDVLNKYSTREAALTAFKAFSGVADRIDALRKGFNAALVRDGKVGKEQIQRYEQQGQRMMNTSGDAAVPPALIKFVRSEAKFFKRLLKVDDDFRLDAEEFKSLLGLKIKQTDAARVSDAAQALNMLFIYAADEFSSHARVIAAAGRTMDDENTAAKRSTRDAAAASAAAEVEAHAKSNGK